MGKEQLDSFKKSAETHVALIEHQRIEREREQLLQERTALLESTSEGIYGIDTQGRCTFINKAGAALLGYLPEEVLGKKMHWLIHHSYADGSPYPLDECQIYRTLETKQSIRLDNEVLWRRDGSSFSVEYSSSPILHGDQVQGAVVTFTDISQRRKAEQAYQESQLRLNLAISATRLGTWYCDLPFDELIWTETVKEHFWLPPEARVTIDVFYECLHSDDRERTRQAIENAIDNHAPYDIEYRTVSPEGQLKWIRAIGRCFYDATGKPYRFDGITLDVTDRKQNELALEEMSKQTDDFISIVTHELRTPLTAIKGNLQLAQRQLRRMSRQEAVQEDQIWQAITSVQNLLDRTERQVEVQNRLVNDLVDASRIRANKLELQVELCDLVQIVRETVENQRNIAPTRSISLHTPALELPVQADAARVGQVVNNYLSNALKYSEEDRPVAVRIEQKGTMARVEVHDEGPGLSPAEQQRIWERFYRVEGIEVKSGSGVGLGLGLHICRSIIERQGGEVGVESTVGCGSTFWFSLPIV